MANDGVSPEGLLSDLGSFDEPTVARATESLMAWGPGIVADLLALPPTPARSLDLQRLIDALGRSSDSRAVPLLEHFLLSRDQRTDLLAAHALALHRSVEHVVEFIQREINKSPSQLFRLNSLLGLILEEMELQTPNASPSKIWAEHERTFAARDPSFPALASPPPPAGWARAHSKGSTPSSSSPSANGVSPYFHPLALLGRPAGPSSSPPAGR